MGINVDDRGVSPEYDLGDKFTLVMVQDPDAPRTAPAVFIVPKGTHSVRKWLANIMTQRAQKERRRGPTPLIAPSDYALEATADGIAVVDAATRQVVWKLVTAAAAPAANPDAVPQTTQVVAEPPPPATEVATPTPIPEEAATAGAPSPLEPRPAETAQEFERRMRDEHGLVDFMVATWWIENGPRIKAEHPDWRIVTDDVSMVEPAANDAQQQADAQPAT